MKQTSLRRAKNHIVKFLDESGLQVIKPSEIKELLYLNKDRWRLAGSTTIKTFLAFLLEETKLRKAEFVFPFRRETRYTWGDGSDYEVFMSLKPNSYFTHFTAMFLQELTDQIPKTIYLNYEQPPKRNVQRQLVQNRIDAAFNRPPRLSGNIASYKDVRICMLNGMHTGQLGVIETETRDGGRIRVTDIERTLISITVRPEYSGGVYEVAKAYRLAHGRVSINKLSAMLKKLDYVYPYHQAVGFYLEKTGLYQDSQIDLIRKFDIKFDFYLTYQMRNKQHSKKWRLYFPEGL